MRAGCDVADLKVGLVMRGRDFQHAGAEGEIDMLVGDDRQQRLIFDRQRTAHVFADEMRIALVLRIHGDGGSPGMTSGRVVAMVSQVPGSSTTSTLK
jgi:hypothetical protein